MTHSMNVVRTGMSAYMGIAASIAAERASTEALTLSLPREYANVAYGPHASTRMGCTSHPEVHVTYLHARTHRTWHVKFSY